MSRRAAALVGPGKGPRVKRREQGGFLLVRGLRKGEVVIARMIEPADGFVAREASLWIGKDGDYQLEVDSAFLEVEYQGTNKSFVAIMVTGQVPDAVSAN